MPAAISPQLWATRGSHMVPGYHGGGDGLGEGGAGLGVAYLLSPQTLDAISYRAEMLCTPPTRRGEPPLGCSS